MVETVAAHQQLSETKPLQMGSGMSVTSANDHPALQLAEVSKTFVGTVALNKVNLTVKSGSVHGLLGENGSGKSTLIKVLAGYHTPDPGGQIRLFGRQMELPIARGAYDRLAMSFVHQDLGLVPDLSIAENLLVRDVTRGAEFRLNWRDVRSRSADILSRHGLPIDPRRAVSSLSRSEQSMVAIIRAINDLSEWTDRNVGGLLVLDEPSGAFSAVQKRWMSEVVDSFVSQGGSVLLISHDNDEILHLTDEITVLRDGVAVDTVKTSSTNDAELTELIVGRALNAVPNRAGTANSEPLAHVQHLLGGQLRGVGFTARSGEILGLTGLLGSGFEEVLPFLFGASIADAGDLTIGHVKVSIPEMTPQAAIAFGISFVPEDRITQGCVGELSIDDNINLCVLDRYRGTGGIRRKQLRRDADQSVSTYGVKAPHAGVYVRNLSGGNQQKVVLAKWLKRNPKLLLLQEPTVGLDIGARFEIFATLRDFVSKGGAVVCASSDWEQLALLCDRVAVFGSGQLTDYLSHDDLSETTIGHACYEATRRTKASPEKEMISND